MACLQEVEFVDSSKVRRESGESVGRGAHLRLDREADLSRCGDHPDGR
jgi:hypothetical protein